MCNMQMSFECYVTMWTIIHVRLWKLLFVTKYLDAHTEARPNRPWAKWV